MPVFECTGPSTFSRLPRGARNDEPRLISTFQPLQAVNPSAEKKPANRLYSVVLPTGRKKVMPLIIIPILSRQIAEPTEISGPLQAGLSTQGGARLHRCERAPHSGMKRVIV